MGRNSTALVYVMRSTMKPARRRTLGEPRSAVALHLAAEDGMVAAQDVHGGDVHNDVAAGARDAVHFCHRGALLRLVQGVEHVERGHDVERVRRKGDVGHAGERQAGSARLASDAQADRGQIEAVGASEAREELEVVARATPAVEQGRGRIVRPSPGGASGVTKYRNPRYQKCRRSARAVSRSRRSTRHIVPVVN